MIGAERINIVPVLIWMLHFVQHDDEGEWRDLCAKRWSMGDK